VLAWSITEVVRYSYYACDRLGAKPYAVTWCRYSLFFVLYPLGVFGEMTLMYHTLDPANMAPIAAAVGISATVGVGVLQTIMWLYGPFFPVLYMHLVRQRAKEIGGKKKRAPRPARGVEFPTPPATPGKPAPKGRDTRPTTWTGKQAFAVSVGAVSEELEKGVTSERAWRANYGKHVVANVREAAKSPESCVQIAEAGLAWLHSNFEYVEADGSVKMLDEAMLDDEKLFFTGEIQGKGKAPSEQLEVPYSDGTLSGDKLKAKLDEWAECGTIEPTCRDAIALLIDNQGDWLDLSDMYFVLLGASSAMGPLIPLLKYGANVIAVDIDRPNVWKMLVTKARDSPGKLIFPLTKTQKQCKTDNELFEAAGCNLLEQPAQISNWLVDLEPKKELTIGFYGYLDGGMHVKLAMAGDAVMKKVSAMRSTDTAFAYLCSPTDVFQYPESARNAMDENYTDASLLHKLLLRPLSLFGQCLPGATEPIETEHGDVYVIDGIVNKQGPNYALAKRLQHWRAMVARKDGQTVSSNIAPSTATASVLSNKLFAMAYGGFKYFPPLEVFYQDTSNAVMGALLLHDVQNEEGISYGSAEINNPLELFARGACHGGIWRCAYHFDSMGVAHVLAYTVHSSVGAGIAASVGGVYLAHGAGVLSSCWGATTGVAGAFLVPSV